MTVLEFLVSSGIKHGRLSPSPFNDALYSVNTVLQMGQVTDLSFKSFFSVAEVEKILLLVPQCVRQGKHRAEQVGIRRKLQCSYTYIHTYIYIHIIC